MTGFEYTPQFQTLGTDFVVSTGRVLVSGMVVSNTSAFNIVFMLVDADGTAVMEINVNTDETRTFNFKRPVEFVNGLTISPLINNSDLSATVFATRGL